MNKEFTIVVSIPLEDGDVTPLASKFKVRLNELILIHGIMSFNFNPVTPIGSKLKIEHLGVESFGGSGTVSIYSSPCGEYTMGYIGAKVQYVSY